MLDQNPEEVLAAFRRLTKLKSPTQIASESALTLSTAKRWKKGGGKRDLPTGKVLEQMADYINALESKSGQKVSRGTSDATEPEGAAFIVDPDLARRLIGRVRPEDRATRIEMLREIEDAYLEHGQPFPDWLEELRKSVR